MSYASTASTRNAVGSLLGAVAAAGNSISSLFDTTAQGVGMVNKYVTTASQKQALEAEGELVDYEDRMLDRLATERAKSDKELRVFFKEDPANETSWQNHRQNLQKKIEARRNPSAA
jgi:hypothetical protein